MYWYLMVSMKEGLFFYVRAGDHPREHLWPLSMLTESKLFRYLLMCSSIMAVHKSHVLKRLNKGRNELISFLLLVSPPLLQLGLWDFAFLLVSDWQQIIFFSSFIHSIKIYLFVGAV